MYFPVNLFVLASLAALPAVALAQRAAPIGVTKVIKENVRAGQTFVGTVYPIKQSKIGSAVDGRVAEFPVNEGDFVTKGSALARLLTETIKQELIAAEAEHKLRQEELKELENGSRPDEIRQTQASMLAAKANLEYQVKRFERTVTLFNRQAANDDDLQLVEAERIKAEQVYADAVAAHNLMVAGPRTEKIAQAQARVSMQGAVVQKLKDQLRKHTMIAPFDGYVIAEHTEIGEWVDRGDLVAEMVALDEVEVMVHVLESHVPHIKLGMTANVLVSALPDQLFTGTVSRIIPQADVQARTFPVKIRIKNVIDESGPMIKSGMICRVNLATGPKTEGLMVNKDALVLGGKTPVVYIVDSSGDQATVNPVPVRLGVAQGRLIQVTGELKAGQSVVVRGNERLRPGQPVSVVAELKPDAEPEAKAINSSLE